MGLFAHARRGSQSLISIVHASRLFISVTVLAASLSATSLARAEDAPKGQLQLGPDFGLIRRAAQPNGAGIEYAPGMAYGAHAQILTAPWLRFSLYYLHARQPLTIPDASLYEGATVHPERDHLSSYVLGARIQPTLNLGERLHLWASAGAGWGKASAPAMRIGAASGTMQVGPREGVFVELPFGVGGSFDIIARWLAVSVDATYAPLTNQSGDLYREVQAIDAQGQLVHVHSMPKLGPSMVATASLIIEL